MKREYQEVIAMIHMPEDCEARILATLKQKPKKLSRRLGRVLLAAAGVFGLLPPAGGSRNTPPPAITRGTK